MGEDNRRGNVVNVEANQSELKWIPSVLGKLRCHINFALQHFKRSFVVRSYSSNLIQSFVCHMMQVEFESDQQLVMDEDMRYVPHFTCLLLLLLPIIKQNRYSDAHKLVIIFGRATLFYQFLFCEMTLYCLIIRIGNQELLRT